MIIKQVIHLFRSPKSLCNFVDFSSSFLRFVLQRCFSACRFSLARVLCRETEDFLTFNTSSTSQQGIMKRHRIRASRVTQPLVSEDQVFLSCLQTDQFLKCQHVTMKDLKWSKMTNSFDYCAFTGDLWHLGQQPRRHSWPEAEATLKPSTSGIFEPLPDQEEIALRSSMTSRASNHSGSCIFSV